MYILHCTRSKSLIHTHAEPIFLKKKRHVFNYVRTSSKRTAPDTRLSPQAKKGKSSDLEADNRIQSMFVSFAVLALWEDRRAPTLSLLILWLVGRRGTRRMHRGPRSLNWTKTQAGKLRRRKTPCKRPPSPVAVPCLRRIRVADAVGGA